MDAWMNCRNCGYNGDEGFHNEIWFSFFFFLDKEFISYHIIWPQPF